MYKHSKLQYILTGTYASERRITLVKLDGQRLPKQALQINQKDEGI